MKSAATSLSTSRFRSSPPSRATSPSCATRPSRSARSKRASRRGAKGLLKDVSLFDIYRGPGVAIGKKSVAFNLVLRADDRSLTGEEADEDVQSILAALKADHNAVLR